jgi:hypothetical protein
MLHHCSMLGPGSGMCVLLLLLPRARGATGAAVLAHHMPSMGPRKGSWANFKRYMPDVYNYAQCLRGTASQTAPCSRPGPNTQLQWHQPHTTVHQCSSSLSCWAAAAALHQAGRDQPHTSCCCCCYCIARCQVFSCWRAGLEEGTTPHQLLQLPVLMLLHLVRRGGWLPAGRW